MKRLLVAMLLAASASTVVAQDSPEPPGVVHVVVVWLKEPGNAGHRQQIIEGSHKLRTIPGIQDLRVGTVIPSDRAVVDDSFDVALSMRFASREAMDAYLEHPDHVNTVKTWFVPVMDRYRVYDFYDE